MSPFEFVPAIISNTLDPGIRQIMSKIAVIAGVALNSNEWGTNSN